MKTTAQGTVYDSLEEQYHHLNISTSLINPSSDFTIFNLADLGVPLPFSLPPSRLNFFVFAFIKRAICN